MNSQLILIGIVTIIALIIIERLYKTIRNNEKDAIQTTYRDNNFADIIKINDASIHQRMLDPLTGLPGQSIFDERLKNILEYSKKHRRVFGVMILNIDEFNNINRIYGTPFGNRLLAEVANRLKTMLRQVDTVSRYAGDCFFFILPELSNPDIAISIAQRMQDSIIEPFYIGSHRIFITASIGIAIYSPEDKSSENLIINADNALTKAKLAGRNTYRLHNMLDPKINAEYDSVLNSYLEANDFIEKTILYYQPYIEAYSKKTSIVHVIPHINYQEIGLIPYSKFSITLKESGKMSELGLWELKEAINQLKHWESNGFRPEKLMFNFSFHQIEEAEFIAKVSGILEETNIEKNRIIFDIAEDGAKENEQVLPSLLKTLANLKINISIGMTELGKLALDNIVDFPFNYLKIDEKIVRNLMMRLDNEPIITSLIRIANNSNIIVIAEGVDSEMQKNKLIELGCSTMEGRYFLPPMPPEKLFDKEISKTHQAEKKTPIDHFSR